MSYLMEFCGQCDQLCREQDLELIGERMLCVHCAADVGIEECGDQVEERKLEELDKGIKHD